MNKLKQVPFNRVVFFLCLIGMGAYGQKQTKTYKESFKVTSETVLDINISHTDIEFETWDRPEVSIEATIEIDGVSSEEAEHYFRDGGIEIVGNSKKVSISTGSENTFLFGNNFSVMNDFHFELPEIPDMDHITLEMAVLPELLEVFPPIPPMPSHEFDYDAFKKVAERVLQRF